MESKRSNVFVFSYPFSPTTGGTSPLVVDHGEALHVVDSLSFM
jgi:hypothetical protein